MNSVCVFGFENYVDIYKEIKGIDPAGFLTLNPLTTNNYLLIL